MTKKLEGAGLRGQVAGETSLSTVGQIEGLAYRGHKIELLAEKYFCKILEKYEYSFDGLIHPIHKKGKVKGYLISKKN